MRAGEAMIPASDDGLIRGDGAFDAFPVRDGRTFARAAHLDRLERSCLALALPCPRADLETDIDLLLERRLRTATQSCASCSRAAVTGSAAWSRRGDVAG